MKVSIVVVIFFIFVFSVYLVTASVDITEDRTDLRGVIIDRAIALVGTFLELTDTPSSYGAANECVKMNAGGNALVFGTCAAVGGGDFSFTDFQDSFDLNISGLLFNYNQSLNVPNDSLLLNIANITGFLFNYNQTMGIDIHDQDLNTTSSVRFHNASITYNFTAFNATINHLQVTEHFHAIGDPIAFNFVGANDDLTLNLTGVAGDFIVEQDASKFMSFNEPSAGNDFKVFQVFSKEAQDTTEFTITKAGPAHTSYFVRSLALVGNTSVITSPFNCTTFAGNVDCSTDATGPDLFVLDDIELNGTIFVPKEDINIQGTTVLQWLYNQSLNVPNNATSLDITNITNFDFNYNQTQATIAADIWVNETGDTMTGNLNLDNANVTDQGSGSYMRFDNGRMIIVLKR